MAKNYDKCIFAKDFVQKYLSDNYRECKWVIHNTVKRELSNDELDDYIGAAHIALMKAAIRYRKDKGANFSTYANQNIRSAVIDKLRYDNRSCRNTRTQIVSLDDMSENEALFIETVEDTSQDSVENQIEIKSIIDTLLSKLNSFERNVTLLKMDGLCNAEIARKLYCSEKDVKNVFEVTYKRSEFIRLLKQLELKVSKRHI